MKTLQFYNLVLKIRVSFCKLVVLKFFCGFEVQLYSILTLESLIDNQMYEVVTYLLTVIRTRITQGKIIQT